MGTPTEEISDRPDSANSLDSFIELSATLNMHNLNTEHTHTHRYYISQRGQYTLNLDKNARFFGRVFPLPLINYEFVFISFLELNILPVIGGHSLDLRSDRLCNGRDSQLSGSTSDASPLENASYVLLFRFYLDQKIKKLRLSLE